MDAIAKRFEIETSQVRKRKERFEEKLKKGDLVETKDDLEFWRSVKEEAEGNIKVTFVSERGFHHSWRSDLAKLDGPTLLSIFEECKRFLNLEPNARFLQYDPPKNYDPLAMQREISKAVTVITGLLEQKLKEEEESQKKEPHEKQRPRKNA